ncbi:MAG: hypothetical protein ACHQU0_03450, partial [Candidatus Paceibacteria bacterium]
NKSMKIEIGKKYRINSGFEDARAVITHKFTHKSQSKYPYVGYITFGDGSGEPGCWSETGKYEDNVCNDLKPTYIKRQHWVNVYKEDGEIRVGKQVFRNRNAAIKNSSVRSERVKTVLVYEDNIEG